MLLVDDEPFILRGLARILEGTAFSVVPCQTPGQAIDQVTRDDVVLVVSDMTMPEMSGLELLRALRKLDAELPVVFMTGHSDQDLMREALECGVSEYVTKPFDFRAFRQMVERQARPPGKGCRSGTWRLSAGG